MSRAALRVGLVCPYSLDVPGGVQAHVLGLAEPVSYTHLTLPTSDLV